MEVFSLAWPRFKPILHTMIAITHSTISFSTDLTSFNEELTSIYRKDSIAYASDSTSFTLDSTLIQMESTSFYIHILNTCNSFCTDSVRFIADLHSSVSDANYRVIEIVCLLLEWWPDWLYIRWAFFKWEIGSLKKSGHLFILKKIKRRKI